MNISQIEHNLQKLTKDFSKNTFIYDLLLAYGFPKATIIRLKKGGLNLSELKSEIAWKKKLLYRVIDNNKDLHDTITELSEDVKAVKHDPRFIIVTDHDTLLAIDRKTKDTLDIPILDVAKHIDFFLPWVGMEKTQTQSENPADVKAAERMAKLFDEIKKDNPSKKIEVHGLNVFISRLLFCFFAEDTGIFEKGQFTNAIGSHTKADGSDLNTYLDRLFEVMNTPIKDRRNLPAFLNAFPYVNGGLFRTKYNAPVFTKRSRQAIINSGELDWSKINPDIFGSMMQAVITPEQRGGLGIHYTSVPNIMKVIEPLFLNELKEEFEAAKGNTKLLNQLLHRIWKIKIFDPACGSGNFLVISYKELRRLEMKIFKELNSLALSNINLGNFYGIELDDFAQEIAILSLWLADHQMNLEFFKEFGRTKPPLPLRGPGNIIHGNALRVDWGKICPKKDSDEIYVLGNPPYSGARIQDKKQKNDMDFIFKGISKYKDLDYIACWFYSGAKYIKYSNSKLAFVSTNSICQGDQVSLLWPNIFRMGIEIFFAVQSFKWTNNARYNAGVSVIVVGLSNKNDKTKYIFNEKHKKQAHSINAYLVDGERVIIERRIKSVSGLPLMLKGNMPYDGGFLIFNTDEKDFYIKKYPDSEKYFKRLLGANEFLDNIERWCLWIDDESLEHALSIRFIKDRVKKVRELRLGSSDEGAHKLSERPYQFREINITKSNSIVVPLTTSERREYIPIGFIDSKYIVTNAISIIYDSEPWLFSLLSSKIHLVWIKSVCGSLETRIRYSSVLGYNTFPFPLISNTQKKELEMHVYRILEEREKHSEKTLAQLYNPDKMPQSLKEAHQQLDLAVERCYRGQPFKNDEERLEHLFKLYEQMITEEKINNGELNFEKFSTKKLKREKHA